MNSMFATSNVSIREKVVLAAAAGLLAVLCACATTSAPQSSPVLEAAAISELRVERDGGATIVSLLGLAEPEYTAFQQDDPARIVVDLAQVRPGQISDAVAVYDGSVEEISVEAFEDSAGADRTRVEISLAGAASYDVVALEDRLEIRIAPASEFELAGDDPWTGSTLAMNEAIEDPLEVVEDAEAMAEAAPEATTLLDVMAESEGESVVIELLADGRIDGASQFVLEDPLRLVVDLPELVSKTASAEFAVQTDEVSRVRVGQHSGKVRVVVDGSEGASGF